MSLDAVKAATSPEVVRTCFDGQARITAEAFKGIVARLASAHGGEPDFGDLEPEMALAAFANKYKEVLKTFVTDEAKLEALTKRELVRALFEGKATVTQEAFKALLTKQLEMLGKGAPAFPEDLDEKLDLKDFVEAHEATYQLSSITGHEVLSVLFLVSATLSKEEFVKLVAHQLEMLHGLEAALKPDELADGLSWHDFSVAYKSTMTKGLQGQDAEVLEKVTCDELVKTLFQLHATVSAEKFVSVVKRQAGMMKKPVPETFVVPPVLGSREFMDTYKETMAKVLA